MKMPNKQELQQIAFNHLTNIHVRNFMNIYKNFTPKPYSVLVIDGTIALENTLRFRKNLSKKI